MPNRTLCQVLTELRKLNETRNYSSLEGYIEEIQGLANKMEAALFDKKDVEEYGKRRHELRGQVRELKKEIEDLKATLEANGSTLKIQKSSTPSYWDD